MCPSCTTSRVSSRFLTEIVSKLVFLQWGLNFFFSLSWTSISVSSYGPFPSVDPSFTGFLSVLVPLRSSRSPVMTVKSSQVVPQGSYRHEETGFVSRSGPSSFGHGVFTNTYSSVHQDRYRTEVRVETSQPLCLSSRGSYVTTTDVCRSRVKEGSKGRVKGSLVQGFQLITVEEGKLMTSYSSYLVIVNVTQRDPFIDN